MSNARKVFVAALLVWLAWAVAPVADAQPPIRIGASLSQTGGSAALGQTHLRGYKLCVKHLNEKGRGAGAEARAGCLRRRVGPCHGRPSL